MLLSFIHLNGEVWGRGRICDTDLQYFQPFPLLHYRSLPPTKQWKGLPNELMVIGNFREYCELNCIPQNNILKS